MTPDSALPLLAIVLAGLSLAFTVLALVVGRRQLASLVRASAGPLDEPLLVVIPARNEALRLEPTLAALLAEPSPALQVLVVDDRSSDGTAMVVERAAMADPRVRLLRLHEDPPPGVFGKPRALAAAIDDARARGALPARVLFLDADVLLSPGALGGLVAAKRASGAAALSGVPRLACESAVEELFVPPLVSVVTGRFPPRRVHDARDPTAFLNGQLVLVDTQALDDAGGWRGVAHTVLEDVALARALKARGHALRLADLRALSSTRMYGSLGEIAAGFGKNAIALLGRSAGLVGLFAFALSLLPASAVALALVGHAVGGSSSMLAAVVVAGGAVLGVQAMARRLAGVAVWPVVVLPLAYLGVALILGTASVRALLGRPLTWRGRSYSASGNP